MKKVCLNSWVIYTSLGSKIGEDLDGSSPTWLLIAIVAWCHDICYRKYINFEPDLKYKLDDFLGDFLMKIRDDETNVQCTKYDRYFYPANIVEIINRVSFSREQKYGDGDWPTILGDIGTLVRNVTSDADKLGPWVMWDYTGVWTMSLRIINGLIAGRSLIKNMQWAWC